MVVRENLTFGKRPNNNIFLTLQVEGGGHSAGVMAYVPQVAWCQNLSLRDNILFGQDFDQARYDRVIHDCALGLDIQILADGDRSKVSAVHSEVSDHTESSVLDPHFCVCRSHVYPTP